MADLESMVRVGKVLLPVEGLRRIRMRSLRPAGSHLLYRMCECVARSWSLW